jgi:hypothetical protein
MTSLHEKFLKIEKDISNERGEFNLFALAYRDIEENKFDILLSAEWIKVEDKEIMKYIVHVIKNELTSEEMINISRIVLLDRNNPVLKTLNSLIKISHSIAEFKECRFNNITLDKVIIFSSK